LQILLYPERKLMIRKFEPSDSAVIESILKKIPTFTSDEVDVAMELVKIAAANPMQNDYHLYVFIENGIIIGYHCIGRRPLTDGVYDLYWIVTDPQHSSKGIGKQLLKHAEEFVNEKNGRWLLIETSSKESYSATRNFYLRNNYSIIGEIKDFYKVGDALMIFGKYFNNKKSEG
jgi:ribosomal protein S18 acetylase RimI-like enzyme